MPSLDEIFKQMTKDWQLEIKTVVFKWYEQHKVIPLLDEFDLSDFNYWEIKIIDDVILKLSHMKAVEISEYSHWDMPYKATKQIWEVIKKWLAFYRSKDYALTDIDWNDI